MLDSAAVFKARLEAVGIDDAVITKFIASGINTMARLAWSSSCQPGVGPDDLFVASVVKNLGLLREDQVSPGDLAGFRRVWFESHTVAVHDLKSKLDRGDDAAPRRMPPPERDSKLRDQRKRLLGVDITGILVPSNSLVDFCMTMKDDETLRFVSPDKCTAREQEMSGVKREQFVKPNAAGQLVLTQSVVTGTADMTTEHRVRLALQRRSLAMDQCDLMPYSEMESYHSFLFSLVASPAPPDFMSIDVLQVLNADRAIWSKMAEYTTAGISLRPDGTYPLLDALKQARIHPMVSCLLQPLPMGSRSRAKGNDRERSGPYQEEKRGDDRKGGGKGKGNKGGKSSSGKGGKGGKSKGASKAFVRMPMPLIGYKSHATNGKKICFDFNLPHGCKLEVSGQDHSCASGVHECAGCLSSGHGLQQCTK